MNRHNQVTCSQLLVCITSLPVVEGRSLCALHQQMVAGLQDKRDKDKDNDDDGEEAAGEVGGASQM